MGVSIIFFWSCLGLKIAIQTISTRNDKTKASTVLFSILFYLITRNPLVFESAAFLTDNAAGYKNLGSKSFTQEDHAHPDGKGGTCRP